jgi:phosphoglucomutase
MSELFHFDALRKFFQSGVRMVCDGMHGSTGLYATRILEEQQIQTWYAPPARFAASNAAVAWARR